MLERDRRRPVGLSVPFTRRGIDMIRLVFLLRRAPNLSLEEFHTYWRDTHGPLVASYATVVGMLRYVQVHALDDDFNACR